jgi:hypothetical protein
MYTLATPDAAAERPCRASGGLKPPQYGSYNPPCEGCFSFGNGCQAIEIAKACFGRFFQMRVEIVG